MAKVPITVLGYRCERCGHEWIPKSFKKEPLACPKCHSPYWNRPRQNKANYADFKNTISKVLLGAGQPLTWTEIRTNGKLPQLFPNNRWVKQLESDIGLKRNRDNHGIIRWSLESGG
jgi:DNA-directed RNA polymerase subunit RPC12/RpoP